MATKTHEELIEQLRKAFAAAETADTNWSYQLVQKFGNMKAGDERYTAAGRGEAGTPLREAYVAFMAASETYNDAIREARQGGAL